MKYSIIFVFFIKYINCQKSITYINKQSQLFAIYEVKPFDNLKYFSKNSFKANSIIVTDFYEIEHHNFNNQSIRLLFHEEPEVITSYADNTRIAGYLGEIWTFLSEYANFRFILLNAPEKRIGIRLTNHSSYNGLLRYIEYNEADIIASIQMLPGWADVIDFCLPLYKDRIRLFTKVIYRDNEFWMMYLLSGEAWLATAIILVLFCIACMVNNEFTTQWTDEKKSTKIIDIAFYYSSLIIDRSYYLFTCNKKGGILNIVACLHSLLLFSYINARLLSIMMQQTEYIPFQNLENLAKRTNYTVLVEKDSLVHLKYELLQTYQNYKDDLRFIMKNKRIKFMPSRKRMFHLACTSEIPYVIMESEYFKENVVEYGCNIKAYGKSYYRSFFAGGVKKNFKYKRTIDIGLLKLFERGILTAQKNRLLGLEKTYDKLDKIYQPININKISGLIFIYFCGVVLAIFILLLENIGKILENKNKG